MCMRTRRNERRAARTKRAQVLMDPHEYKRLESIAKQEGTSVGEVERVLKMADGAFLLVDVHAGRYGLRELAERAVHLNAPG